MILNSIGFMQSSSVFDKLKITAQLPGVRRNWECRRGLTGFSQKPANAVLGLVQLRFGISHRAIQYFGHLLVLVAFDLMRQEDGPVPGRQIFNRAC